MYKKLYHEYKVMDILIYEYINYFISVVTGLTFLTVCINFFSLFRSGISKTPWRAIGAFLLALMFLFYVIERKYDWISPTVHIIELMAYIAILLALLLEPSLKAFTNTYLSQESKGNTANTENRNIALSYFIYGIIFLLLLLINSFMLVNNEEKSITFIITCISLVILFSIITIQIRRYYLEKNEEDFSTRRINIGFLWAFIFFTLRQITLIISHLPFGEDIVLIRLQSQDYSLVWWLADGFALVGILLFLRVYISHVFHNKTQKLFFTLVSVSVLVSVSTMLLLTYFLFGSVSNSNKTLVEKGAKTLNFIIDERGDTSFRLAESLGTNEEFVKLLALNEKEEVENSLSLFAASLNADFVRLYNSYGEVILAPSDPRELGELNNKDNYVIYVIEEKRAIKTYDQEEGVLAPVVVVRSIYPVLNDETVLGAIEVGYRFDNAFVDKVKRETSLDISIYADDIRSATTIVTSDNISRWVGSKETSSEVIEKTLKNQEALTLEVTQLSKRYYASFRSISDINGNPIGMISSLTLFDEVLEDMRQQQLTTALVVTNISLGASFIGYLLISKNRSSSPVIDKSAKRGRKKNV